MRTKLPVVTAALASGVLASTALAATPAAAQAASYKQSTVHKARTHAAYRSPSLGKTLQPTVHIVRGLARIKIF